jgi:hypothetical protein
MLSNIILVSHVINIFFIFLIGVAYLGKKTCMPYHIQALGMSWQDIPSNTRLIIMALMKVAGSGFIATSIATACLLINYLSYGTYGLLVVVFVVECLVWLFSTLITFKVARTTGASTPWLFCAIILFLTVVTLILSFFV